MSYFLRFSPEGKLFTVTEEERENESEDAFPKDYIFEWRVEYDVESSALISFLEPSVASLVSLVKTKKPDEEKLRAIEDEDGYIVFDEEGACRIFGSELSCKRIGEEIAKFQVEHIFETCEDLGREWDKINAKLDGLFMMKPLVFDTDLRFLQLRAKELILIWTPVHYRILDDFRDEQNALMRTEILILSDLKPFSSHWPEAWRKRREKRGIAKDAQGELRGILNLPVNNEEKAVEAMTALGKFAANKNYAAFELLTLVYEKGLPRRADILEDLGTLLFAYNMQTHLALWFAKRNKVFCALCRIPPFPDREGLYRVPDGLVKEEQVYKSGYTAVVTQWRACREAARFALYEKYGYPTEGLRYNAQGKCIGQPFKSKFART